MKRIVSRVLTVTLSILLVGYPALIYVGMTTFSPAVLAFFVLMLLLVRLAVTWRVAASKLKPLLPLSVAAAVPAVVSWVFNSAQALLLIPVIINITLFVTFAVSLVRGPTMIARFAALEEPAITDEISRYCRKVTVVWCVFFVANAAIAYYTVFYTSKEYWTLYNGLISYVLIGGLLLGERLVRRFVQKREISKIQ